MKNRGRMLSSIAVAAVFLSANPATAQDANPAYNSTMYYDAAHQNWMGTLTWISCDRNNNPFYELTGTYQYQHYAVNELVGYCVNGQMEPV